jgi:CBS domain-containing protein
LVFCRRDLSDAIERKQPVTRAVIEKKIASLRLELENAVKSKAFSECSRLQSKLDELTLKQSELPTLDELRGDVIAAEMEMSSAVQNRDFEGAAEAKIKVDMAKQRLSEAVADDEDFCDNLESINVCDNNENGISRSQLDADIADIWAQITDSISEKDFVKANTLQKILEQKESLLAQFPSIEQLQSQIIKTKTEMEDCVSKKDYAKASSLSDALALLEKKVAEEKIAESTTKRDCTSSDVKVAKVNGQTMSFSSRSKLEEEISLVSALVSQCVADRDFKKADLLQKDIDNLTKLRDYLPSLNELQQRMTSKRAEMDAAAAKKDFVRADELHRAVKETERMIADETKIASSSNTHKRRSSSIQMVSAPASNTIVSTSDTKSVQSAPIRTSASVISTNSQQNASSMSMSPKRSTKSRSVAKLRPTAPLVSQTSHTILSATKLLANKRGNACVVVNEHGVLEGILTDTDITRRVVAKFVDPGSTAVSEVMTPNPMCVAMTDSAMDALMTMVEHHFRHLPVVDSDGSVVGLLDIAKCLDDAISKLERKQNSNANTAENVVKHVVSQQGDIGTSSAALQVLLTNALSKAFGGQMMPTLRGVLAGKPKTMVSPLSMIQDAGILMAQDRKAALIVDEGVLVGVFTFKDMMTRAIAKELSLSTIAVSEVMTPNPEAVSPDITVLEALQIMHDQRFLTLPVCEADGTVVGLVDVMDVIYGCGGTDGWRSIFNVAMDVQDDSSEAGSVSCFSALERRGFPLPVDSQVDYNDATSITSRKSDLVSVRIQPKFDKSVAKLRPVTPYLSGIDDTILSVAQLLKNKRGSACLIVNVDGTLAGILTDTDITRRVVAKHVSPATTEVFHVMTRDPTCVTLSDSAADALTIMVENHFRHLPVVDELGSVVGLLDIAKCLNDAISKLEAIQESSNFAAETAVHKAILDQGGDISQVQALQGLLGNLISQAFGSRTSPTLRSVLAGKPSTIVSPETNIRDTAIIMNNVRKAALIVDDGELVGIFSFKDCMTRAVAAEVSLDTTPVRDVMTPYPESVSPDITILEALQIMHDHRFLTLPVCENDGTVVGLVDVMDVIYGCGGADGWRSIFNSALDIDDASVVGSVISKQKPFTPNFRKAEAMKSPLSTPSVKLNVPTTLEFLDRDDQTSLAGSTIGDERVSKLMSPDDLSESLLGSTANVVVFKVFCTVSGSSHRIRCEPRLTDLIVAIAAKTSLPGT